MGRCSSSYALKHICPEGQTLPITILNNIVNIVFSTKTEDKEIPFQRDTVRIDAQKSMNIWLLLFDSKRNCLAFALHR